MVKISNPHQDFYDFICRQHEEAIAILKKFDSDFSGLVERRNHMFHGIWGWRIKDGKNHPTCYYAGKTADGKKKNTLDSMTLYPDKIRIYAERLAIQSHRIRRASDLIFEKPDLIDANTTTRYYFAEESEMKLLAEKGIQTESIGRSYKDRADPAKNSKE